MTTALVILHDMYYKLPNVNQTMQNSVSAAEGGQVPLTDWMGGMAKETSVVNNNDHRKQTDQLRQKQRKRTYNKVNTLLCISQKL